MLAGVGHPVGVFGLAETLVIAPVVTSSASRFGVSRVFSGVGPAPDMPGMGGEQSIAEDKRHHRALGPELWII